MSKRIDIVGSMLECIHYVCFRRRSLQDHHHSNVLARGHDKYVKRGTQSAYHDRTRRVRFILATLLFLVPTTSRIVLIPFVVRLSLI